MISFLVRFFGLLLALLVAVFCYLWFMAPSTATALASKAQLHFSGMQEHSLQVGEFEMHYIEGGAGEPLLLVHGFGADKSNWLAVAPELSKRFRVIAVDLPGFGESDRPMGSDYRITTQVDRLRQFVQQLGLEQIHIAGNSMGGAVAGVYAARYADHVRSAWLLAPAFVQTAPESELGKVLAAGQPNPLLPSSHKDVQDVIDWVFVNPPYIPAPVLYHLGEVGIERRPLLVDIFSQINNEKLVLENAMKGTPVPTLILWGNRDRLLHVGGAEKLAAGIPDSRVVILDNVGHAPMMEVPQASVDAFLDFVPALEG